MTKCNLNETCENEQNLNIDKCGSEENTDDNVTPFKDQENPLISSMNA